VFVDDVEERYRAFRSRGLTRLNVRSLQSTPRRLIRRWGLREFAVTDPDGNNL
jgi:hypothetical protein